VASVELSVRTLPTATVGVEPLPPLRFAADLHDAVATEGVDDELAAGLAYGHVTTLLPYLPQSAYGRDLIDTEHQVAVLTNDRLQATFLLGWGGRLWSLLDLTTGRELLYANRALQPGNLALRDAWFAGGVEWNLGTTGHHPLTCEPLHAAMITLPDGTVGLRLWEFERLRELVVQIDAWLPDGADRLATMITVSNVNVHDVPVYWWSNIAVPQTVDTRVLAPTETAYRFDYRRTLRRVGMPVDEGVARSYPSRSPYAVDYFFDLGAEESPWIAAVDGNGYGLLQTSTRQLRGRKLFVWGTEAGGRHWQEWLSPLGGEYLEIQAGLARTQLEHLPLPAGERWSWLETYGAATLDPTVAHGPWPGAVAAGSAAVGAQRAWFDRQVALGDAVRDQPIGDRLQRGSGWGALEARRRAATTEPSPEQPGTPFPPTDLGPDQEPWLTLLDRGDPQWTGQPPTSYQTAPGWRSLLEGASGAYAMLQLGVARWAGGDRLGAVDAWEQSLRRQPSAIGWRNVAVANAGEDHDRAVTAYQEARTLDPALVALVVEHLDLLLSLQRWEVVLAEIDLLPAGQRTDPRIALAEARAAVAVGDAERAGRLLEPGLVLPQLREGAKLLAPLWRGYRSLLVGPEIAAAEELPYAYDFSMRTDEPTRPGDPPPT
jgi:hypothetical protein